MEATLDPILSAKPSTRSRWIGRVVSGVPESLAPVLGIVLLACVALYAVPRTAVLGAVLLTGYLGGAVAIHARVGDPLASHTLGLYLRDPRVRALV